MAHTVFCPTSPTCTPGANPPDVAVTNRQVKRCSIGLLLGLAVTACASAPPPRPASWRQGDRSYAGAYLDWMVRGEMAQHHIRGLSLVVVSDRQTLFSRGYGYADVARGVPATIDTVYRIGSVSKVVSASLVLSQVEQNLLDLDVPVTTYEPAFSIRSRFPAAPITLRQLLSHHSGLPGDVLRGMWVASPAPLSTVTQLLAEEDLVAPPGAMFHYSNIGYSLVGHVIETVSHASFPDLARHTLFEPLGMSSSSFEHTAELMPRLAVGYRGDRVVAPTPLRDVSAGSMLSTASDVGRFLQMMLSGGALGAVRVLRPESVSTLFTPQFADCALDFGKRVALDWVVGGLSARGDDEPVSWHNGNAPPFQAHVSVLRNARLGVVVLSNSAEAAPVVTRLGARALELMHEADTGVVPPEPGAPEVTEIPVPPADLDRLVGEYAGMGGQTTSIWRDGGRLRAWFFGRELELIPTGRDVFVPRASAFFGLFGRTLTELTLSFEHAGGYDVAVLRGGATHVVFERVARAAIPDAWRRRVGAYTADTAGETFDFESIALAADGGALTLSIAERAHDGSGMGGGAIRLLPISDDAAIVAGISIGMGEGATIRAIHDEHGEALRYSGFLLRPRR